MRRSKSFIPAVLMGLLVVGIALTLASGVLASDKGKKHHSQDYLVSVGVVATCADNAGSFAGIYEGKDITVTFRYAVDGGKHGKHDKHKDHGVEIYENGRHVYNYADILCPKVGESANQLSGTQVRVSGRWTDDKTLAAHKIYITK